MPFKKAKQLVERETKKEGIEIPGKEAKEELRRIKATLSTYSKRTSEYLNKLTYKGHQADRADYISAVKKQLAEVLKDKTATKKELLKFRLSLSQRSENFKKRVIEEQTNHELQSVKDVFKSVNLKINTRDLARSYLRIPQNGRIPISTISENMKGLFKEADTDALKKELKKNSPKVHEILNHYVNGNESAAKKTKKELIDHLKFLGKCEEIREKTGLKKLKDTDINYILTSLVKIGQKQDKVAEYFIKNVNKLKSLDNNSFNSLISKMNSKDMRDFLLSAIVSLNEGKKQESVSRMKLALRTENILEKRKNLSTKKLQKAIKKLKDEIADSYVDNILKNIPWASESKSEKESHKENINARKEIAHSKFAIASYKKDILLAETKKTIVNAYLSKKNRNLSSKEAESTIGKILKAKDSEALQQIIQKNKIDSERLVSLQAAELKTEIARQELQVKIAYNENRVIRGKDRLQDVMKRFYKTGEISDKAKVVLLSEFKYRYETLSELIRKQDVNAINAEVQFESYNSKYKNIKKAPVKNVQNILMHSTGYFTLLKNLYNATTKAIGSLQSWKIVLDNPQQKQEINHKIQELRKKAKQYAKQMNKVTEFLGGKKDAQLLNIDTQINSPLFMPLITKELKPYIETITKEGQKIAQIAGQAGQIENNIKRQEKEYARLVPDQFEKGLKTLDNLANTMLNARNKAINLKSQIRKLIQKNPKNYPESMLMERKKYLEGVIKNIDENLKDPNSPFSMASIKRVKATRVKLKEAYDKYLKNGLLKGVTIAVIISGALLFAMPMGLGLRAGGSFIGGKIFGTGTLMAKSSGVVGGIVGSAGGATLGGALAMEGLDYIDFADFGDEIWKYERLRNTFLYSLAFSAGAAVAAKGVMLTIQRLAKGGRIISKMPRITGWSQRVVNKRYLNKIILKDRAYLKSQAAGALQQQKGLLAKFAYSGIREFQQESLEETVGQVHPVAEFLLSVYNSSDGINVKLGMQNINALDIGISVENGKLAYTTKTPQEFVANLEKKFQTSQINRDEGPSYDATINDDGSVTLNLSTHSLDPNTGEVLISNASSITIQPANESTNIDVDTELSRIPGLKPQSSWLSGEAGPEAIGNKYTINNSEDAFKAFGEFYKRGFNVVDKGGGKFKVTKGDIAVEISVPADVMAENKQKLNQWTNTPQKKSAFIKYMLKFNGNLQKFRAKYPKLAKLLPADLTKLKVIPRFNPNRLGSTFGSMSLDSASDMRKKAKREKETAVLSNKKNKKAAAKPVKPADTIDRNNKMAMKELGDLKSELEKIGLHKIAEEIANPESAFLPSTGQEIKTLIQRKKIVEELKVLHQEIQFRADHLRTLGLGKEVKELTNYSDTSKYRSLQERIDEMNRLERLVDDIGDISNYLRQNGLVKEATELSNLNDRSIYQTFDQRIDKAQYLYGEIHNLRKWGIEFNKNNAADIIALINGKSDHGLELKKMMTLYAGLEFKPNSELQEVYLDKRMQTKIKEWLPNSSESTINRIIEATKHKFDLSGIKPEDKLILKANPHLITPEVIQSMIAGGVEMTYQGKTIKVYTGRKLGEGGIAKVKEIWYVEKGKTELNNAVIKTIKTENELYATYFIYEGQNINELKAALTGKSVNHISGLIVGGDKFMIYSKVSDKNGESRDLGKNDSRNIPPNEQMRYLADSFLGLSETHAAGFTHGDYKPENIVIGTRKTQKGKINAGELIDFGSAINNNNIINAANPEGIITTINIQIEGRTFEVPAIKKGDDNYPMPFTPQYHNPNLMADAVKGKVPFNAGDKYAAGTTLMAKLEEFGHVTKDKPGDDFDHSYSLKPNASESAKKLFAIAQKLQNVRNHPYEFMNNNEANGKDPQYISLTEAARQIRNITL